MNIFYYFYYSYKLLRIKLSIINKKLINLRQLKTLLLSLLPGFFCYVCYTLFMLVFDFSFIWTLSIFFALFAIPMLEICCFFYWVWYAYAWVCPLFFCICSTCTKGMSAFSAAFIISMPEVYYFFYGICYVCIWVCLLFLLHLLCLYLRFVRFFCCICCTYAWDLLLFFASIVFIPKFVHFFYYICCI